MKDSHLSGRLQWWRTREVLGLAVVTWLFVIAGCARPPAPTSVPPIAAPPAPLAERPPQLQQFEATAYSITGKTASGAHTRKGIVAADPRILPLGSRIRVHDAGKYSGEYVVADTGRTIRGREIDIYIAAPAEAKRFGRRQVDVEVLDSADAH